MDAHERRLHYRWAFDAPAELLIPGGPKVDGRVLDIGPGGMSVSAKASPRSGVNCLVGVILPQGPDAARRLQLPASVVHCTGSTAHGVKIGLQFAALTKDAADVLSRFLSSWIGPADQVPFEPGT